MTASSGFVRLAVKVSRRKRYENKSIQSKFTRNKSVKILCEKKRILTGKARGKRDTFGKMKTKSENLLAQITPNLQNGSVHLQRRKCGKLNCKCARGERHESLFLFTRHNGKLYKIYIPKSIIEEVSAAIMMKSE